MLARTVQTYKKHIQYMVVSVISVISAVGTYFVLTSSRSYLLSVFLFVDILLLLYVVYLTQKRISKTLKLKKHYKRSGNRFLKQVVVLFSCVTIIPAACVFVFSAIFFNIGVESLFKAPVKAVIENANQVANIYINEIRNALENYAYGVGMQLHGVIDDIMFSKSDVEEILANETSGLGIDAFVFRAVNDGQDKIVFARSPFAMSVQFEDIPSTVWTLGNGEVFSWESGVSVIAVEVLSQEVGVYLLVSKNIDQQVLDHKHKIKNAIHEYTSIASQKTSLKLTFMALFSIVIMMLLMSVILIGIIFVNRLVRPIDKLILAAENISLGDYNTLITAPRFNNELDILISSFNSMIVKLEAQKRELIISHRQNAWRDIARKIAHEIKNPLTPIQLSAERLRKKYSLSVNDDVFNMCVDTIIRQVNSIGALVNEFSDFARMPAPKLEKVDIVQIIRETVFLQSSSNKNINFQIILNGRNSYIACVDQFQINQVIINLLQNSINAITESQKKTGNIYVSLLIFKDDFSITVEDDGPGFSDNAIEHALDPYYTTREFGNGLGLAIVYKIIVEHGGKIALSNSTKFGGASVNITLPTSAV